ncbi:P-loop NTPase fold protein [Roseovarius sp. EL26]|uniref:P-loop NTPase fold protein n=1 Tax=Roseovarius sp. EL26 TaxID=2126672 RepID=UPI000EA06CB0|nr:P-loop NTPase fold protein [Roseovarius sp. EL26]
MKNPAVDAYELAQQRISLASKAHSTGLNLSTRTMEIDGDSHKGDPRFKALNELPPEIAKLQELRALRLANTEISDITLLRGLEKLEKLNLDGTGVRDLGPLTELGNLKELRFSDTPVLNADPVLASLLKINPQARRTESILDYLRRSSDWRVAALTALQHGLADTGQYAGPLDGVLGPQTLEALALIEFPDAPDIERQVSSRFPKMRQDIVYDVAEILEGHTDSPTLAIKEGLFSDMAPPSSNFTQNQPKRRVKAPVTSPPSETAPFYPDRPAVEDQLNRKAVAETLGTIIDEVWSDHDSTREDNSFIVHLHGRWGSGKTSILNFLRDVLLSGKIAPQKPKDPWLNAESGPPWVIVEYNAWRNQNLGPAWWTLMDSVYRQAHKQLGDWSGKDGWRVRIRHLSWQVRTGWAPTIAGLLVGLVALYLVFFHKLPNDSNWGETTKNLTGLIGLIGSFFLVKGEMTFFNARAAKRYVELTRDPLGPLTQRYEAMVGEIGRPVAVFIDDLDRCDAKFVVELLQDIQTLFRRARVLYVVAADRDWICSSYEQIYKSFSEPIAEPGRTLGHMFLEKMFQLSIEVPHLVQVQRDEFWNQLVLKQQPTSSDERDAIDRKITEQLELANTEQEIIEVVDQFRSDPSHAAIAGARAFQRMQSKDLTREREHFLGQYSHLLEPNPRAMKRLLNAYGFRRGFDIQSSHRSDPDALVRWTILENRWPVLADHLSGRTAGRADSRLVEQLLHNSEVKTVAGEMTWEMLRHVASAPRHAPKQK